VSECSIAVDPPSPLWPSVGPAGGSLRGERQYEAGAGNHEVGKQQLARLLPEAISRPGHSIGRPAWPAFNRIPLRHLRCALLTYIGPAYRSFRLVFSAFRKAIARTTPPHNSST